MLYKLALMLAIFFFFVFNMWVAQGYNK